MDALDVRDGPGGLVVCAAGDYAMEYPVSMRVDLLAFTVFEVPGVSTNAIYGANQGDTEIAVIVHQGACLDIQTTVDADYRTWSGL